MLNVTRSSKVKIGKLMDLVTTDDFRKSSSSDLRVEDV